MKMCSNHQDMTVDFYGRRYWNDPRLNFSNAAIDSITLGPDVAQKLMWIPDIFIVNAKAASISQTFKPDWGMRIQSNGDVVMSVK